MVQPDSLLAGIVGHLPVGLQVAGRFGSDELLVRQCEMLSRALWPLNAGEGA